MLFFVFCVEEFANVGERDIVGAGLVVDDSDRSCAVDAVDSVGSELEVEARGADG